MESFDPREGEWRQEPSMQADPGYTRDMNQIECGTEQHGARSSFAVAILGHKLYAIGGDDGHSILDSVESFDFTTGVWTTEAKLSSRRSCLAAHTVGGRLYVVGGWGEAGELDVVEYYDGSKWHSS
eukprot:CAMPEP_0184314440 /NCGR_PEP_ID=MMETSP1049-20130417/74150_1 /TAXON_ID=77928 /ORGANISM="Proteomonas sulcata, Strain CCMP704" /LENGTH=125 /DNA_ID=CAMNT_0026632353 /DNA_START=9 /DNA_END=383 /DNA_ORIENTATION=-